MHAVEAYLAFPQIDGEVDKLAVFLDEVLYPMWLQILVCLFLEVQTDCGTAAKRVATWVLDD